MEEYEVRKPPIGIHPKWLWEVQRRKALGAAIARYVAEGFSVPPEWVTEHNELLDKEITREKKMEYPAVVNGEKYWYNSAFHKGWVQLSIWQVNYKEKLATGSFRSDNTQVQVTCRFDELFKERPTPGTL